MTETMPRLDIVENSDGEATAVQITATPDFLERLAVDIAKLAHGRRTNGGCIFKREDGSVFTLSFVRAALPPPAQEDAK